MGEVFFVPDEHSASLNHIISHSTEDLYSSPSQLLNSQLIAPSGPEDMYIFLSILHSYYSVHTLGLP